MTKSWKIWAARAARLGSLKGSGLRGRCRGFDRKIRVSSHYLFIPYNIRIHIRPVHLRASSDCFMYHCSSTFLLVLVLLSAVRYLPLPIFTSLNENSRRAVLYRGTSKHGTTYEVCGSDTVISQSRSCFGTLRQARSDLFSCSKVQTNPLLLYFMRLRLQDTDR